MKPLPYLHTMPRVDKDIDDCLTFIAKQPLGKPAERYLDIMQGISAVRRAPLGNPVKARRLKSGYELRRYSAAQFVIVYAYLKPDKEFPHGAVSIRAIRHRRVKSVFLGVKESVEPYIYNSPRHAA